MICRRGAGADGATVEARLIFRRAFQKLTEQKGWTDEDVLMEQALEVKAEMRCRLSVKVDTEAALAHVNAAAASGCSSANAAIRTRLWAQTKKKTTSWKSRI